MMTSSVPTLLRAALVDYTYPFAYAAVSFLIPPSSQSVKIIITTTQPFKTMVN